MASKLGAAMLVLGTAWMTACGGQGPGGPDPNDPAPKDPAPKDVSGDWVGKWANDDGSTGDLVVSFVQSDSSITGTLVTADCFTNEPIHAERDDAGAMSGAANVVLLDFAGLFAGKGASGGYAGDCNDGSGSVAGTWKIQRM